MGCQQLTYQKNNFLQVAYRKNEQPQKKNVLDYFSFGMPMPDRNVEGDYRYGYQGEYAEKEPETGHNAFELRMWDSRIGRWLTTDPAGVGSSPYVGMLNNPISEVDPDGACPCSVCPENCNDLPQGATPLIGEGGFVNDTGFAIQNLDEVIINAPGATNGFDFSNATTGLFGASVINAGFGDQISNFSNSNFKNIAIPKEIKYLKGTTSTLGNLFTGINVGVNTYSLANGDIGLGKFSFRMTGTGTSLYAAAATGAAAPAVVVGGVFALTETMYDANAVSVKLRQEIANTRHIHRIYSTDVFSKGFWNEISRQMTPSNWLQGLSY